MALIGNYSVILKSPARFMSGTTVSGDRANFNRSSNARNFYANPVISNKSAVPNGYLPPASWVIPQKAGGLASYTALTALGTVTASNLAGGINVVADSLTGFVSINANGELVASGTASITGLGLLNTPIALGILNAAASVGATGLITNAAVALLAFQTASLTGKVVLTTSDLRANGLMVADILPYTELSPESLADAVWGKSLVDELDSGTYGKLIKQIKAMISAGL